MRALLRPLLGPMAHCAAMFEPCRGVAKKLENCFVLLRAQVLHWVGTYFRLQERRKAEKERMKVFFHVGGLTNLGGILTQNGVAAKTSWGCSTHFGGDCLHHKAESDAGTFFDMSFFNHYVIMA